MEKIIIAGCVIADENDRVLLERFQIGDTEAAYELPYANLGHDQLAADALIRLFHDMYQLDVAVGDVLGDAARLHLAQEATCSFYASRLVLPAKLDDDRWSYVNLHQRGIGGIGLFPYAEALSQELQHGRLALP